MSAGFGLRENKCVLQFRAPHVVLPSICNICMNAAHARSGFTAITSRHARCVEVYRPTFHAASVERRPEITWFEWNRDGAHFGDSGEGQQTAWVAYVSRDPFENNWSALFCCGNTTYGSYRPSRRCAFSQPRNSHSYFSMAPAGPRTKR
jgi:hypothetical protein